MKHVVAFVTASVVFSIPVFIMINSIARFTRSDWLWFLGIVGGSIVLIAAGVWAILTVVSTKQKPSTLG